MKWNGLPVVIFGTSGIATEIATIIQDINNRNYTNQYNILGYISENVEDIGCCIGKYKIVASDVNFKDFAYKFKELGVVLPNGFPNVKKKIYEKLLSEIDNLVYPNVISPFCNIGEYDTINMGKGNIIAAGCTITNNITIGDFNLFNLNSTIGHNCVLGDFCVINPIASISGNVNISSCVLIGSHASILQGLSIGQSSIIGLGAFVVKNVKPYSKMVCVPAKNLSNYKEHENE